MIGRTYQQAVNPTTSRCHGRCSHRVVKAISDHRHCTDVVRSSSSSQRWIHASRSSLHEPYYPHRWSAGGAPSSSLTETPYYSNATSNFGYSIVTPSCSLRNHASTTTRHASTESMPRTTRTTTATYDLDEDPLYNAAATYSPITTTSSKTTVNTLGDIFSRASCHRNIDIPAEEYIRSTQASAAAAMMVAANATAAATTTTTTYVDYRPDAEDHLQVLRDLFQPQQQDTTPNEDSDEDCYRYDDEGYEVDF